MSLTKITGQRSPHRLEHCLEHSILTGTGNGGQRVLGTRIPVQADHSVLVHGPIQRKTLYSAIPATGETH